MFVFLSEQKINFSQSRDAAIDNLKCGVAFGCSSNFTDLTTVPRISARQVRLHDLRQVIKKWTDAAAPRELFCEHDSFEDDLDEYYEAEYEKTLASRYVSRPATYRTRLDRWRKLFYDGDYINETDFLGHFRLYRDALSDPSKS